jgi:hypothetical protein
MTRIFNLLSKLFRVNRVKYRTYSQILYERMLKQDWEKLSTHSERQKIQMGLSSFVVTNYTSSKAPLD